MTIFSVFSNGVLVLVLSWQLCAAEALSASSASSSTVVTEVPPLVDVPVWSMATFNNDEDKTTNMNLLTYATPVSIRPDRLYALGLFKATKSRENFLRSKTCILQLMGECDAHISCVRLLGGTSGADVCKQEELSKTHGIELEQLFESEDDDDDDNYDDDDSSLPMVLPGCVRYLKLTMVGDSPIDCDDHGEGSHDVVLCKVDRMWTSSKAEDGPYLSTGRLRELGLITEQGRIAPLPSDSL